MTVGEMCTRKVVTADREETLVDAAAKMRGSHVGALVVVDSHARPVGILTDRDIVVSAIAQSPERVRSLVVGDVMTGDVVTLRAGEPVDAALRTMPVHGIRRLPVVDTEGRLVGILTLDDMLRVFSIELGRLVGLVALEQKRERAVRAG
jgi:CBS domain-containing protein